MQHSGREDAVAEPDVQRFPGRDPAPAQDDVLGPGGADETGEPLGAAGAGDDAQLHLGLTERRRVRRHAQVARQRELATTAQSEAVDRRNRRLGHGLEQPARLVPECAPRLGCLDVEVTHVLDVGSGDERLLTRAGEDHDAHRLVSGELAQPAAQVGERADVERVHRFLAIDRDEGDRLFELDSNQTGTLPLRKSTIRFPPRPFPTRRARRHECFMPGPCLAGSRRSRTSARPA